MKQCYEHGFQIEAMQKVLADSTGKYLKISSHPTDITIERFEASIAFDAIEAHDIRRLRAE